VVELATDWQVVGFTDDLGRPALNARLAAARSRAVIQELAKHPTASAVSRPPLAVGKPLCCYVNDNTNEASRQANRRAELTLQLPPGAAVERVLAMTAASAGLRSVDDTTPPLMGRRLDLQP
jgi:hypothetical protein